MAGELVRRGINPDDISVRAALPYFVNYDVLGILEHNGN
jgi:hypothetical protein